MKVELRGLPPETPSLGVFTIAGKRAPVVVQWGSRYFALGGWVEATKLPVPVYVEGVGVHIGARVRPTKAAEKSK